MHKEIMAYNDYVLQRLHGNVESMAILSPGRDDGRRKRDAIILSFRDAKVSVLEFDDSIHGLRTSLEGMKIFIAELVCSMHYFEGPDWQHLKRGREKFARGPLVQADPQGRCGGVLLYDSQMIILKAAQVIFLWTFSRLMSYEYANEIGDEYNVCASWVPAIDLCMRIITMLTDK
eukprot:Gb_25541 [translate_table: standard]